MTVSFKSLMSALLPTDGGPLQHFEVSNWYTIRRDGDIDTYEGTIPFEDFVKGGHMAPSQIKSAHAAKLRHAARNAE